MGVAGILVEGLERSESEVVGEKEEEKHATH